MTTAPALDPLDLLGLASELAARKDASAIRTACDRAYYAAFLFTRNRLEQLGRATPLNNGGDHRYIPSQLKAAPGGVGYGNELDRLYGHRNRYTYQTGTPAVPSPGWMLATANDIIQFVRGLTP